MSIGEQIRKYRKESGISQKELGRRLGISQQQIAQYENGTRIPKIETINSIAGALGVGTKRLYPEFSREEWEKTDTYQNGKRKYDTAIKGIAAMLSYKYENIQEETFEDESFYTVTENGETHILSSLTLSWILNCLIDMLPPLYELAKNVPPPSGKQTSNDKKHSEIADCDPDNETKPED